MADSGHIVEVLKSRGLRLSSSQQETLDRIHVTGRKGTNTASKLFFLQLEKEQVKMLYDKYEIDFLMFDYEIEPYLAYAVNVLAPKYGVSIPT